MAADDEIAVVEVDSNFLNQVVADEGQSVTVDNNPQPLQGTSKEFVAMSNDDVQCFISDQENKNTVKKTQHDIQKFSRFLRSKGEQKEIHHIDHELLDEYISNFILSARKQDGTEYEPVSLRSIVSSLDRKLKRQKYPYSIMQNDGPAFNLTRTALKAKQKSLKKQGKGNRPFEAQPITDEEVDTLYNKGLLGGDSPNALLNTLWLNNSVHFGLRGVRENYQLR